MNESAATISSTADSQNGWGPERQVSRSVRPANRTELRGALEANEVFLSLLEIRPDYSHCGINE